VAVEDGVERPLRFEVADGEVMGGLFAAVASLGADLGDGGEVGVGVRGLSGRARARRRQRGVDRADPPFPLGGLPALGGELLVALDREGRVAARAEVLDDVEVQAVPEVPRVAGAGQLPRGPRGDLLVGAAHRLLEEAGDDIPAVAAVGLVGLLLLAEVVLAGRVRRRVGLQAPVRPERRLSIVAVGHTPAPAARDLKIARGGRTRDPDSARGTADHTAFEREPLSYIRRVEYGNRP